MSAYTADPGLLAEFQRNLPALEKFLRANGANVTLRIDGVEDDGKPITIASQTAPRASPTFDPRVVEALRKKYAR